MVPAAAKLQVQVRNTTSGPELLINGKPTAPTILFVNFEADPKYQQVRLDEVATAGRHGVNLLSVTTYMPWQQEGKELDYSGTDAGIDAILKANPNALMIPRFGVTWPPSWWIEKHTEEFMLYDDGKRQTASVHSRVWRKAAMDSITALVRHLEEKYGDHMLGYHPSGQHTGEWFYDRLWEGRLAGFEAPARDAFRAYLQEKYMTDAALRKAWHDPDAELAAVVVPTIEEQTHCKAGAFRDPALEQKVIDFFEFQNLDMATAVEDMCKAVKAGAPNKPAVTFYGYPFELATLPQGPQVSGHLAMDYLLKSPYVDIVCSPISYFDRQPGGGGYFMSAVDSVQKHGKLWLDEDDTRTHFTEAEAGYGRCENMAETTGVLARNYGHIATRGAAEWWMDLGGTGWFQGDELNEFLSKLQSDYQQSFGKLTAYHPEIAVIVDERSFLYMEPGRQITTHLIGEFRRQWYRIGAPTATYLLDDLVAGRVPAAKMYIMLNAFRLDPAQIEAIRKHACKKGNTIMWMYAPGIVREASFSPDNVSSVTGMRLVRTDKGDGKIVSAGKAFSASHAHLDPMFAVDDPAAMSLATYEDGGATAVAEKTVNGCRMVYSGVLQLPASLLRLLAKEAGVHIYVDSDDVVAAGNGLVAIHASSDGNKKLTMPSECELMDALTRKSIRKGVSFSLQMKRGETRLLRRVK